LEEDEEIFPPFAEKQKPRIIEMQVTYEVKSNNGNKGDRNTVGNQSMNRSSNFLMFGSELPKRRYCDFCQILQPYRTKHCKLCEACIAKFDHHCFWIGRLIRRMCRRA